VGKVAEKRVRAKNALSQNINAGFLKRETTQKLEEYLKRAPHQYQRDKIQAELDRRKGPDAGQLFQQQLQPKAPSVPPELKQQLAALNGVMPQGGKAQPTDELERLRNKYLDEGVAAGKIKDDEGFARAQSNFMRVQKELNRRKNGEEAQEVVVKEKEKEPTVKPDSKYGPLATGQLRDKLDAARKLGKDEMAKRIEAELKRRGEGSQAPAPKAQSKDLPEGLDKYDADNMRRIDREVKADTTSRTGKENYDWEDSLSKDAKVLGRGSYGTAILGGNGDVVKRGEIGENEAALIDRAGKLGVGPRVISAELDGPADYTPGAKKGHIAMTLVEGEPIGYRTGPEVSNAYWQARATLHRGGIAHNDMHIENVLVGSDGKGRFVDMGMAQDNPKAALAEAMGVFTNPLPGTSKDWKPNGMTGNGDWQAQRYDNIGGPLIRDVERKGMQSARQRLEQEHPNAYTIYRNRANAINRMREMGLTDQEITDTMFHGIRSTDSSFERGAMGKLTNDQAQEIIEVLYDGIN
jgi:hypothetical protein